MVTCSQQYSDYSSQQIALLLQNVYGISCDVVHPLTVHYCTPYHIAYTWWAQNFSAQNPRNTPPINSLLIQYPLPSKAVYCYHALISSLFSCCYETNVTFGTCPSEEILVKTLTFFWQTWFACTVTGEVIASSWPSALEID